MPTDSVRILVVDQNPSRRDSTSQVLRDAGWSVLDSKTGAEALERAGENVDLIVLDMALSDIDGFEVRRRIRLGELTARVPVIHLATTFATNLDIVQGIDAGLDGYLVHPVEPPVLIATVMAFVRARQAEAAIRQLSADLSAADRHHDEFLAALAHELRNPLSPISSALALMSECLDKPDQLIKLRDLAERQTKQLVRLVDELPCKKKQADPFPPVQFSTGATQREPPAVPLAHETQGPAKVAPQLVRHSRHRRKVLVVDDMRPLSYLLGRLVERIGHEVLTADSGPEALKLISTFQPDVIFTDISMPDMNGYEFAAEVRCRHSPSIQLVAMTGLVRDSDRQRALSEGFNHFMLKPPESAELVRFFASLDEKSE